MSEKPKRPAMTGQKFYRLSKRDFENDAIISEIAEGLRKYDQMETYYEPLLQAKDAEIEKLKAQRLNYEELYSIIQNNLTYVGKLSWVEMRAIAQAILKTQEQKATALKKEV